jgi:cell division protein FtsL
MTTRERISRLGPLGFFALILAPVAASACFLVWTRVTTLRLGYELARLREEVERLEEKNRVLQTSVSALESPERLRELGRELGLRPPRAEEVKPRPLAEAAR